MSFDRSFFNKKCVLFSGKYSAVCELLTGRQRACSWRPVSNCSFSGDVEQKMKVGHVRELGSHLCYLTCFLSFNFKRTRDYLRVVTCLERFCAFGCRRIAKNEYAYLHNTAPGRHQDGTKTAPRKRLPPGSDGQVAF